MKNKTNHLVRNEVFDFLHTYAGLDHDHWYHYYDLELSMDLKQLKFSSVFHFRNHILYDEISDSFLIFDLLFHLRLILERLSKDKYD